MTNETIAARIAAEKDRWTELKRRWRELGLPGSEYSPGDFLACLLLSQAGGGVEELAGRVRAAAETFAALRRDGRISTALIGTDATAVLALALMDAPSGAGEAVRPPAPEPGPELAHCPHCDHRFDECAVGAYAEQDLGEGEPFAAEIPTPAPVTECPHCGHGFAACEAGEYAAPAAEAPTETASPLPTDEAVQAAAPESCLHVGSDGRCAACTADETVECSGGSCEQQLIAAKAHQCKNPDCDAAFCDECVDGSLSKYGYCDDCFMTECDGCQVDIESGTETHCASPDCKEQPDVCDECAPRLLDESGRCNVCTGGEDRDCSDCDTTFTSARLTSCKNADDCGHDYCVDCKGTNLTAHGYCQDCRTIDCDGCKEEIEAGEEKHCANESCSKKGDDFCDECVGRLLTEDGRCGKCAGEEESPCASCGAYCIASRIEKCKGASCESTYCSDCRPRGLDRGGFCESCAA